MSPAKAPTDAEVLAYFYRVPEIQTDGFNRWVIFETTDIIRFPGEWPEQVLRRACKGGALYRKYGIRPLLRPFDKKAAAKAKRDAAKRSAS
jgi:hypothetical protein